MLYFLTGLFVLAFLAWGVGAGVNMPSDGKSWFGKVWSASNTRAQIAAGVSRLDPQEAQDRIRGIIDDVKQRQEDLKQQQKDRTQDLLQRIEDQKK